MRATGKAKNGARGKTKTQVVLLRVYYLTVIADCICSIKYLERTYVHKKRIDRSLLGCVATVDGERRLFLTHLKGEKAVTGSQGILSQWSHEKDQPITQKRTEAFKKA